MTFCSRWPCIQWRLLCFVWVSKWRTSGGNADVVYFSRPLSFCRYKKTTHTRADAGEKKSVCFSQEPNEEQRCLLCRLYTSLSLASLWCARENVTSRQGVFSSLSIHLTYERDNLLSLSHTPPHPNRMHTGFHCYLVASFEPPRWPFQLLCVVQQMCSLKQMGEKQDRKRMIERAGKRFGETSRHGHKTLTNTTTTTAIALTRANNGHEQPRVDGEILATCMSSLGIWHSCYCWNVFKMDNKVSILNQY